MKQQIEDTLTATVRDLPPDQILQVVDFAGYLRSKYVPGVPQRGSGAAILQVLERVGPLQFAPGELETLLTDIATLRKMDLQTHDRLPA